MSLLRKLMVPAFVLASTFHVHAQIKNAETITAKVSGNCGMCEATIEKAGTIKKEAQVEWDKDKQVATITYDPQKTTAEQVLKRIALAGYDNEKFLAPEEAYSKLHGCCQYERADFAAVEEKAQANAEVSAHASHNSTIALDKQSEVLAPVMANYFMLQEALVKSDAKQAATMAAELQKAIEKVDMASLKTAEHAAWMQTKEKLSGDASGIAKSQDIKKQRQLFSTLSENMYILAKAADLPQMVYYNNCPMFNDGKGANWLSEEKVIKNPYYGSQMLTCGKNVEIIK